MLKVTNLVTVSALALIIASPVYAQAALVGNEAMDERIDTIQTDVADEFAKGEDAARFGTTQFAQGWTGSLSLGYSATSGNTDTSDLSFGGRFRYGNGDWNHTLGFAGEFGDDGGVRSKEELYATYDVNRYFSDQFYVFGMGSVNYDAFASNELDAFLGVGPGYRVINQENMTWRVQAGPGVRFTRDQMGAEATETAAIASSRLYYKVSDASFLTNDTDILYSNASTVLTNDFGMNFKMSDSLTTRVGYRTEYNSDPLPGLKSTDNTFGVSLVVGF